MALSKYTSHKKLKPEELKWTCDPEVFDFESTTSVKPIEGIVGQQRAIKALKLGVDLRSQGYNIFVTGLSGTGKFTTIKTTLESISPDCPEIYDYAYVNNFNDQDRPTLLTFKAGKACKFRKDMGNAIQLLQENIPQVLENEPFLSQKKNLLEEFSTKQQETLDAFEEELKKDGFTLGQVKSGDMARPEIMYVTENGDSILVNQIDELVRKEEITEKKAKEIKKKYTSYQTELQKIFRQSIQVTKEFQERALKLETEAVEHLVTATFDDLKKKYKNKKIHAYLDDAAENIYDNLAVFKGQKPSKEQTPSGYVVDYLKEYEVNIILDNANLKECPVIVETSPTYTNLFGTIEKFSDGRGGWYADFTKVKSGSLLRANGGYLIINAVDAFTEPGVWKTLKRVLLFGKLTIQDMSTAYQFTPSVLQPEPIEINTKIILIGNHQIYSILSNNEPDFNKIFKIKADFDYEMNRTEEALVAYSRVVKKLIDKEELMDFDRSAVASIAEYGARYAGKKDKLTTRFAYIADLTREANFWASDNGDKMVSAYHVDQAYDAARERHGLLESKISERIEEGTVLIDVTGERVGQINALAVYSSGFYSFGKPTRITATVSLGNGSILNVEREAGLSGSTHNKGVLIITGYFKEKFGKKMPLSFNASLVFEQGYGMIDGDSASVTEICALLSCLSEVPLKQSIAITGSVNQKGDIQPIGGVNQKIEGFYDVCKMKGLNKKQGVIIPIQNVKDLMLKDEVVEAVANGEFSIYPVENVDQAIQVLTSVKAGELQKNGRYQANTIYGLVDKNLRAMQKMAKPKPQRSAQKQTTKSKTTKKKKG